VGLLKAAFNGLNTYGKEWAYYLQFALLSLAKWDFSYEQVREAVAAWDRPEMFTIPDIIGIIRQQQEQKKHEWRPSKTGNQAWDNAKLELFSKLGYTIFFNWLNQLEFERVDNKTLFLSVSSRFVRQHIIAHYGKDILAAFEGVEYLEIEVKTPA